MQLSSAALLSLAALFTRVVAEYKIPNDFDSTKVDPDRMLSWCIAQQNSCPMLCGGNTNKNDCDSTELTWACECEDGTSPDLIEYKNTFPHFVCEETFAQCIEANAADAEGQETCKENRNCGNKDPTKAESPSKTTASATGMATSTKGSSATTGTGTSEPTQTGAAVAQEPAGVVAAAMIVGLGLFL